MEEIYQYHHTKRNTLHLVWKNRRLNYFKGKIKGKVLDVGCRDGSFSKLLGNIALGIDIDSNELKKAPFPTKQVDLNGDWGLTDFYDTILLTEVLEHLYFPEIVIAKCKGQLKSDGILIGSVPNAYTLKSKIRFMFNNKHHTSFEDPTHINHFCYKELKDLLKRFFTYTEVIKSGQILLFSAYG